MDIPGGFYYNDQVDDDLCDEDCPCGCDGNRKLCVYSCLDAAQHGHEADADHESGVVTVDGELPF